jgi:hypothetical protein
MWRFLFAFVVFVSGGVIFLIGITDGAWPSIVVGAGVLVLAYVLFRSQRKLAEPLHDPFMEPPRES